MVQSFSVSDLSALLDGRGGQLADWQIVDVREPWELERASIRHPQFRSSPIPMATIPLRLQELDKSRNLLIMCRSGGRSMQVASFLANNGFDKIYNLTGGITAWSREIDPSIPTY